MAEKKLTVGDWQKLRDIGCEYRAWFETASGRLYHRDFKRFADVEDFRRRAAKVGTKLSGYVSMDFKDFWGI